MVNIQILPPQPTKKWERKRFRRNGAFLSQKVTHVRLWKHGEICLIVSSSVQTQIKMCSRDAAAAFRSISAWHCFMWRAAVVCCWQGSVWKVTGRITCVRVHSSVNPCAVPFPAQDESLLTRNYVTRWNKGMRSKQTLWRISTARMCCHYMSNPHLRQRRLPSGPSLQLNRLQWRSGARQSLCTVWLHSFVMFISRWQTLFICDSTRFLWPQCPDSTRYPHLHQPPIFHLWTQEAKVAHHWKL